MTWAKLSDDFGDDCWSLSDAAFRLHVEGLLWSNRKLLDCRIPIDQVARFAKHPDALQELVLGGWWELDGDCAVIVHHSGYQRSAAAVIAQQRANAENGKRGGRPPREQVTPKTRSLSDSKSERDRTGIDETRPSTQLEGTQSESEPLSESVSWNVAAIPGSRVG